MHSEVVVADIEDEDIAAKDTLIVGQLRGLGLCWILRTRDWRRT
jgi:hypothetical protein